jgi:hypothetical protein
LFISIIVIYDEDDQNMFVNYWYVFVLYSMLVGARGGIVVKALRYKPAGRGFDSRWCYWNFSVT